MGISELVRRLLRRQERTPLEQARAASKVLRRKGHDKRRRRPPRPNERLEGGVTWGGYSWTDSSDGRLGGDSGSDSGGGGGGGD